ncbi:alpha/beta hydrolase [Pseudoclavibacter endophyticus]|uniref:Alpha/beta hydrolase n=2 Tax=Pseudoclavibacter endophyticus TaxID=1778590 RepID=A0A6H9WMR6_9MICO|nr:alpha/beta hydrolase [Pseudoclavibacter endophyticus]
MAEHRGGRGRKHLLHHGRSRRRWLRGAVVAGILVLLVVVTLQATPWPSALLIRSVFEKGGAETVAEMEPYVPATGVEDLGVHQYGDDDSSDTTLRAFSADGEGPLPAVVWIHGGAWISGHREDVEPYLQILAAEGYTTIALNYTVGPDAVYPTAVNQLNEALAYIDAHAEELRVDPERIVLAGDSAGAQLASQLTVLTTNPEYAQLIGIEPALASSQLIGTILNCGVYDMRRMADLTGIAAWGFKTALWAYTGTKDWSATYAGATMSTIDFVTEDFPSTYISGGNGDGLTWLQSVPMAERLQSEGVEVTRLFWPEPHQPSLQHEYQFHLDLDEAQTALRETIAFLAGITASNDGS